MLRVALLTAIMALGACATAPAPTPQPAPAILVPTKPAPAPSGSNRRQPVERPGVLEAAAERTAKRAGNMSAGAAGTAAKITGNPMVDSLAGGFVRDVVGGTVREWWSAKP